MFINYGRRNGKRFQMLCEQITELDLQIDFAKKFGLDYKKLEQKKKTLESELDGGNNCETSTKKTKNKQRRLF